MRKRAERFEDLEVWQYAHELVLETYKITRDFPGEEKFGLTTQMRRAGVSIAANIAEGFKKRGIKDKTNFYKYCTRFLGGAQVLFDLIAGSRLSECTYGCNG
jgi:four helix bundle protein